MKQSFKKSLIGLVFILTISSIALPTLAPEAEAWGWETHYSINSEAASVFSNDSFFSERHNTLKTWCVKPDQNWGEKEWHYLDAESYHPLETTGGRLPWALESIFENAVQELEDKNWQKAAELLGAASHFTADSTMPLHSTYDYNPGNNHTNYESEIDSHLSEISTRNYAPRELENVFDSSMKVLEESFNYTDEDPQGGINLSDYLEKDIFWNDTIKKITENRLRAGTQFTANLWYTAMIEAGLTIPASSLSSPSEGANVTNNYPTFKWSSSNEAVSYTLQVSQDKKFTSNDITVKNISGNSYSLENRLSSGSWYWRVRTGDNSTHVGLWSQKIGFTVKSPTEYELFHTTNLSEGGNIILNRDNEKFSEGTKVKVKADPAPGYKFDHWSGDLSGTERSKSLTMDEDKSITANFVKVEKVIQNVMENLGIEIGTSKNEMDYLKNAITQGKIGASLSVTTSEGHAMVNKEYQHEDIDIKVEGISAGEEVSFKVHSENVDGKSIFLNFDKQTLPNPSEAKVFYDGEELSLADDYQDALSSVDETEMKYFVLTGEKGSQFLISIPKFSPIRLQSLPKTIARMDFP